MIVLLPLTRQWVDDYKRHLASQLEDNPCPDLQALVQRWGGYGNIPVEAWDAYDRAMAEWEGLRRELLIRMAIAA
jgi:hypothetical protein